MSAVLEEFKEENLYYIGGIVRDFVLGMECFDIDITYVGNAITYAKTLSNIEVVQIWHRTATPLPFSAAYWMPHLRSTIPADRASVFVPDGLFRPRY